MECGAGTRPPAANSQDSTVMYTMLKVSEMNSKNIETT